jgi:hypothetical protein
MSSINGDMPIAQVGLAGDYGINASVIKKLPVVGVNLQYLIFKRGVGRQSIFWKEENYV